VDGTEQDGQQEGGQEYTKGEIGVVVPASQTVDEEREEETHGDGDDVVLRGVLADAIGDLLALGTDLGLEVGEEGLQGGKGIVGHGLEVDGGGGGGGCGGRGGG